MHRVVVDTNVIVSGFLGGKPGRILDLYRDGMITLCLSDDIIAEYIEVLGRFRGMPQDAVNEFLDSLGAAGRVGWVTPSERFPGVTSDADDSMFLECAVAADAEAIISGDQHLLSLCEFRDIPILSPGEYLERHAAQPDAQ